MAGGTIGRELCSGVVRIGRGCIIRCVTTVTCVRRVRVVPVVTGRTIAGNSRVRTLQHVVVVVDRERSRIPARISRVAHRAIRRDVQRDVVGICCLVKISSVATRASIRRIGVVPVVAGITVICNGNMCASERINGVVVKGRRRPGRFIVAKNTIGRELRGSVVWVRSGLIIRRMAAVAGVRGVVKIPVVAKIAIIGNGGMRTI